MACTRAKLSDATAKMLSDAVNTACSVWGERSLEALEAEERLSFACEKGPSDDEAILALRAVFNAIEVEYKEYTNAEKKEVLELGGLHVIGTERHESRRVDNQLRGRSGRQGDPGSTRYFLSLEDNLFRIFGGDRIQALMSAFRVEDMPIESGMLTNSTKRKRRSSVTFTIFVSNCSITIKC